MDRASCWLPLCIALACSVQKEATSLQRDVPFACEQDTDCPAGSCLSEFGICTRSSGRLENLLFEVTPQPSDPVYGGARFLTVLDVSSAPPAGDWIELAVRPRVPVTGQVVAAPEQQACLGLGQSTLRVALTFTPREQLLGLSLPSYEMETTIDENVREYVFRGSLPPGRYDVYMRPITAGAGPDCRAIPQLFRNRSVGLAQGAAARLELQQPPPSTLLLKVTWRASLEGWRLDVVHPVSGEVLSTEAVLHASDLDPITGIVEATLNYSRQDPVSTVPADELVRLRPPDGVAAGTVLFERSGLEAITRGEGSIGDVTRFGAPIRFQAWVWKRDTDDTPVPGLVSFAAVDLDEVDEGVLASFEAAATVDATGQVNANLLPGRYRVRFTPPGPEMPNLGLMTSYEKMVTVWPTPAPDMQGGHVIDVPEALDLYGRVVADTNDIPLRRVDIRAAPAFTDRNLCPPDVPGMTAPACEQPRAPVLRRALAQDPFIPRTRNGLSDSDGRFTIEGLDCGRCDPEAPTFFDLTVRPDVSTGLPWLVRMSVDPARDEQVLADSPLRIPMPVARPMRVTYGEPAPDAGTVTDDVIDEPRTTGRLSGALVRVFAILDNQGHLVTHPEGLSECLSVSAPDGRCLQSLIQVAEARTGSDGEFLLLLPPDVE